MVRIKIPLKLSRDCTDCHLPSWGGCYLLTSWSPFVVPVRLYSPWLSLPLYPILATILRNLNIRIFSRTSDFFDLLSESWFQTLYFLMITFYPRGVNLIFAGYHNSLAVALKEPNVISTP